MINNFSLPNRIVLRVQDTYPIKVQKSIYDPKERTDGKRILVMRYWPRGVRKSAIDLWIRDVGTSPDLIKDWKAGKITWTQFKQRYMKEMKGDSQREAIKKIADYARTQPVTLLCTDKDSDRCHRSLLKGLVETQL